MAPMTASDLAQVLFTTGLQASDHPTDARVRAAIADRLRVSDADRCAVYVAQEAGDHPDEYAARMRWALRAVSHAYHSNDRHSHDRHSHDRHSHARHRPCRAAA